MATGIWAIHRLTNEKVQNQNQNEVVYWAFFISGILTTQGIRLSLMFDYIFSQTFINHTDNNRKIWNIEKSKFSIPFLCHLPNCGRVDSV